MTATERTKYLHIPLVVVGLIFIVGIYPLAIIGRQVGRGTPASRITYK
jgi:hypothetical protein